MTVHSRRPLLEAPGLEDAPTELIEKRGRGLDLAYWWTGVRRLVTGKYGAWIRREGLDPDDVCSETARRILVANGGDNPFDPSRCAPQVYILIQARSALSHMVVARRRWNREDLAAADATSATVESSDPLESLVVELSVGIEHQAHVVRMYLEGHRVTEIVALLGAAPREVADTIRLVRARARAR